MSVERKKYCVYGEWRESKTDKWMPVTDSSTGEVIAEVPCCTVDEVEDAIASAQAAFPEWSMLSISKRTQYMFKWRNILVEHQEELAYLCAKELGKNLNEARGDVLKAIEPTELACGISYVSQGSASLQVTTGFDTASYRMPLGVVAGIVPFNFPAMIPRGWMVPLAIATGNTVVLKAASHTPLTAMRIMELFYEEGGFPKGVVNLVTCSRQESEIFLTDPRIKAVTFVGTTGVGKHIYSVAAAHGKHLLCRIPVRTYKPAGSEQCPAKVARHRQQDIRYPAATQHIQYRPPRSSSRLAVIAHAVRLALSPGNKGVHDMGRVLVAELYVP